ncbi:MAG: hypothetical protein MJZ60_00300 [Bacteroidaceae bacterium]|nr:hypothetical protein [Bacteroidaceae bacterium]
MKTMVTIEMKSATNQSVASMFNPSNLLKRMGTALTDSRFAIMLANLLSFMLEEKVAPLKALQLLHAILAGISAFLFGGLSIVFQLLLLVWFFLAVWQYSKK